MTNGDDYRVAHEDYETLKGAVNRLFVTDDIEEIPRLYNSAVYRLYRICDYAQRRLAPAAEQEKTEYLQ